MPILLREKNKALMDVIYGDIDLMLNMVTIGAFLSSCPYVMYISLYRTKYCFV